MTIIWKILPIFFQKAFPSFLISSSLLPEETWNANPDTNKNDGATNPLIKFRILNQPVCLNSGIKKALNTWTSIIIMITSPRKRSAEIYLAFSINLFNNWYSKKTKKFVNLKGFIKRLWGFFDFLRVTCARKFVIKNYESFAFYLKIRNKHPFSVVIFAKELKCLE